MSRGPLFFLFCFFADHFLKPLKFVWGLPKWKLLLGKKSILHQEKSGKVTFPLLKNIPLMPLMLHFTRSKDKFPHTRNSHVLIILNKIIKALMQSIKNSYIYS